ncbi:hypothetical protein [Nostoc sp. CMAA1605]|uniref:hypothetical protein n=1 Tax=Nostoc sp. CMAA1605 TaxID=2055159 RepID=UPI001F2A4F7F|nr:hypothetical protein [Nostoc sp. CMAA1605]
MKQESSALPTCSRRERYRRVATGVSDAGASPEGLNVAEIELSLSVLSQKCLDRRISSAEEPCCELAGWHATALPVKP